VNNFIDFQALGGPVFVGRANGAAARRKLAVDQLDLSPDPIEVRIPAQTYAVNSSFFLGLFGPSILRFATPDRFLQHYVIKSSDHVAESIRLAVERALSSRGKLALSDSASKKTA
jgi:hypothetical protein